MSSFLKPALHSAAVPSLLVLVGIAATSSVQAQSLVLNSGDNVTISDTGTFGVIGGVPISNSTSQYSAPLPGPGSNHSAVLTSGTAAFNLTGGYLVSTDEQGIALNITGSGPVTISGGDVNGGHGVGLVDTGTGVVTISGGGFSADSRAGTAFVIGTGAVAEVTGGLFSAPGLDTFSSAPLNIGGSLYLFSFNDAPFLINGVAMNNTSLMNLSPYSKNTISGTLANGDGLNTSFREFNSGTVYLNLPLPAAVPEASTTVSLGLLLILGAGGIIASRRRSVIAPSA